FITQPPVSEGRYAGRPFSFTVGAGGTTPISYVWKLNGTAIPGATTSTYSGTASSGTAGTYVATLSNEAGQIDTSPVTLTVVPLPTGYAGTVLSDSPLSYWRLGETNGSTIAHDYWNGNDGTYTTNVTL